jgi:short-subunit dehydrogenase
MAVRSYQGIRCLVTGASSGIGRAIALELGRRGADLLLCGRSVERLTEVTQLVSSNTQARADSVAADLTLPSDRERLLGRVRDRFAGALDLAVHAAGVGGYGRFETHDPSILPRIFEINLFAVAALCREELPLLRRGTNPAVINIGSIVARRSLPGRAEYSASKHALAGFTDAIRAEWTRDRIRVLLVNPGFTATEFERNVLVDTAIHKTQPRRIMSPENVARATLRALDRGRHEIQLTGPGRWLLLVNRLSPRFVNWGLGRWTVNLYKRGERPAAE